MRSLIDRLPEVDGTPAACFDTRFDKSQLLTGSAAKVIAKKLLRLGYELVAPPGKLLRRRQRRSADERRARARAGVGRITRSIALTAIRPRATPRLTIRYGGGGCWAGDLTAR
jgi:hypothetical protein